MTTNPQPQPMHPWSKKYPVDIEWDSEIPVSTLVEQFEESVQKYKNRTCLHFMGKELTYAEVGDMADRFAKSLQDQGIGKGSKVGLCLPNTPFYVVAYFGALKAGATVVNFNPLYAEKEIEHQINDSATDIMVTINAKQVLPKVEKMLGTTSLKKIITCDLADALPAVKGTAFRVLNGVKSLFGKSDFVSVKEDKEHVSFKKMLKAKGKLKPVTVSPDDLAVLQYTGGTTGVPKAAMLTHANIAANIQQANLWFTAGSNGSGAQEKMLTVLPFFHVFSMTVQMNLSLKLGAEIVMMPKFELEPLLKTIDKESPTMFAAVPTIYKAMADFKDVGKYDLSSLKLCLSGGAPLPETIRNDFKSLTGLDLIEGYGLSETSPIAIANPIHGEKKVNSVGLPLPKTEVRIIDMQFPDKETPVRVEGEICLRGPQVMKGYWNRPDETEKVMDKDGFLHTGDVGYLDEDGYLFIVDRIKDMIIASGLKVFPRKVEDAILLHPDVSETIVIGVKDEYRGETVKAFLVMKEGKSLSDKELTAFLKDKIASYELPKQVEFRDSLPKTMIGKPDRKALVAAERAKEAATALVKPSSPKPPAP